MARLAGVDLPPKKRAEIGLTYIYGIGRSRSRSLLHRAGIEFDKKIGDLTEDEVNKVRQILEEEGLPSTNFYEVGGKADTDPLFPDDPFIAANRRVTITLMREAPPVPPDLKP